jgi:hypothetical protein
MPPAIIAGGIAAVGTIGGALLSSSAQSKAASQANASQQAATQAQLQLGRETLGLNTQIYNSNYGTLSPFVQRGNVAGDSINALLGLPHLLRPSRRWQWTRGFGTTGNNSLYRPVASANPGDAARRHSGELSRRPECLQRG